MVLQKRSMLVAMCGLLLCAFYFAGCCCCYADDGSCPCSCCKVCVPATPTAVASEWGDQIDGESYAMVIQETTEVIQAGEDAPHFVQALLYRGIAEFKQGDFESARADLASAQSLSDRMSKDDQLRLFRAQMVVLAVLGDETGAEQAFNAALAIAPADLQDAIRMEYENAGNR